MSIITDQDRHMLRTRHGGCVECQNAQSKLFRAGLRYCPNCDQIKPVETFGKFTPTAKSKMTLGLRGTCKLCSKKRRKRHQPFEEFNQHQRTERFFERFPESRPLSRKGPYACTLDRRLAGTY